MEDILASIRRIIADDHLHAPKPGYGSPSRRSAATSAANGAESPVSARAPERQRGSYDDVLDAARVAPAERAETRFVSQAEAAATPGDVDPGYTEQSENDYAPAESDTAADSNGYPHAAGSLRTRLADAPSHAHEEPYLTETEPEYHEMAIPDAGDQLLSPPLGASVMSAFETLAATVVLQNTPMLERIMRDLLRPMLKSWLDDNLPTLVERLVRTEIERVARGGRG